MAWQRLMAATRLFFVSLLVLAPSPLPPPLTPPPRLVLVLVRVLVWPSLEPRGVFVLGHLCVGVDERTRALIVSYHEYVWAFCFALRRRTENIEKAATNSSSKLFADGVPSSRRAIVTARNRLSCPARLLYLDTSPRFFARRLLVAWAVAPERF